MILRGEGGGEGDFLKNVRDKLSDSFKKELQPQTLVCVKDHPLGEKIKTPKPSQPLTSPFGKGGLRGISQGLKSPLAPLC